MSQFVGRFVIISALISILLLALGWLVLQRPEIRLSKFEQTQASRFGAIQLDAAPLDDIRITPCARDYCLLVQAGGRDFIIGAGEGAANGLLHNGLLADNLDGVLLTDLGSDQLEGLIGLRDRSLEAGRKSFLKIYGPSGVERVVEGLNAMLETSDVDRSVRFGQGVLPFDTAPAEAVIVDEDPANQMIFDSGVLQVYAFPVETTLLGAEVVYRFDYEGEILIVGGCGARLVDINAAKEGADQSPLIVLPVASRDLLEVIREQAKTAGLVRESRFSTAPLDRCLTANGVSNIQKLAGAKRAVLSPMFPFADSLAEKRIWESEIELAGENSGVQIEAGQIWSSVNLKD